MPFGILCVQADAMERFGAAYGAAAVTAVLRAVAQSVESSLRPTDFVGHAGGNIFLAMLTEYTGPDLSKIAERLRNTINNMKIAWWGEELPVTASFGGATVVIGDDETSLLKTAEDALAKSVAAGGGSGVDANGIGALDHVCNSSHHHHQEKGRAWRAPRRRVESGPCGLRDGHDGALHRSLAAEQQQTGARGRRWLFQASYRQVKESRERHGGGWGKLCRKQRQYAAAEGTIAEGYPGGSEFRQVEQPIDMTVTNEGLRIELMESAKGTFYDIGSLNLNTDGRDIVVVLAQELGKLPNKLAIEGPTDAKSHSNGRNYSNWELSADRANAARRLMQVNGIGENQVTQVRGFADQRMRKLDAPLDPSNRRISLIVQYLVKLEPGYTTASGAGAAAPGTGTTTTDAKKSADPLAAAFAAPSH